MTTRKNPGAAKGSKGAGRAKPASKRVTRPQPERTIPDRSGATARQAAASSATRDQEVHAHAAQAATSDSGGEPSINEAVADAVKSGYDVLSETIAQGRAAAEKFRQGEYNVREVPSDIETLSMRLLQLARQLSTTTFDICEQLVGQFGSVGGPPPPGQVAAEVPPFLATIARAATGTAAASGDISVARDDGAPVMSFTTRFVGTENAFAHTPAVTRPDKPTRHDQIGTTPLAPHDGGGEPLTDIVFTIDLAEGGLVATVTIPDGQTSGIYSGLVIAEGQTVPLGMFVIELAS